MKVISFCRDGIWLKEMPIEVSLTPGLPELQILGLPDTALRESVWRIKAAIRAQGFKWPKSKRIIVQLPAGTRAGRNRKSSDGLDLAVAAALLWETGQVPVPETIPYVYGRLTLTGLVERPNDFIDLPFDTLVLPVLTGELAEPCESDVLELAALQNLGEPRFRAKAAPAYELFRPELPDARVGSSCARVLAVAAAGEHSAMFAGPRGSGKSTGARLIHPLLRDPPPEEWPLLRRIARVFGAKTLARPLVQPHHTTPPVSMVGGGIPVRPGEITRAHGGVLLLDEFLEFDVSAQEALREPLEAGMITIARGGEAAELPARFLLLGTTNLCRCGQYVPIEGHTCNCPEKRRRQYIDRLSGPTLDRFDLLVYTHAWASEEKGRLLADVRAAVERAQTFARDRRGQAGLNRDLGWSVLHEARNPFMLEQLMPLEVESMRRRLAVLRVARTCADLDESEHVTAAHLNEALSLCWYPVHALRSDTER